MSYQPHRLNEFVPNYVPHSDFLPTNQIVDGKPTEVKDLITQYQLEKSKGRVFTQKPADFDPRRYVSVRTFEDVKVSQPISEEQFRNLVNRGAIRQ